MLGSQHSAVCATVIWLTCSSPPYYNTGCIVTHLNPWCWVQLSPQRPHSYIKPSGAKLIDNLQQTKQLESQGSSAAMPRKCKEVHAG